MPGEGFQASAIQTLRNNRNLLKNRKSEAFDPGEHNNFINPPELNIKVSSDFYKSLGVIKIQRLRRAIKIKRFIVTVVTTIIASIILLFLYFSGR